MASEHKVIDSNQRIIQRISRENTELRKTLQEFYERVRENERILSHFSEIETLVMACTSLQELADKLIHEMETRFQVTGTLLLAEPGSFDGRDLEPPVNHPRFRWVSSDQLNAHLSSHTKPFLCGEVSSEQVEFFFPSCSKPIRSMAVVPLCTRGKVWGGLCLGSEEPDRYQADMSTHFLEHLGRKISLGVDNILLVERLKKSALTDSLTGLFNRTHLTTVLQNEWNRRTRYGTPFSCLMIDLDGFKQLNDSYGHHEGDRLLIRFSEFLKKNTRKTDICFRYGGDEFVVVLPYCPLESALATAKKLLQRLPEVRLDLEDGSVCCSASFGAADCSVITSGNTEEILVQADRCLYKAKKKGGSALVPDPASLSPESASQAALPEP